MSGISSAPFQRKRPLKIPIPTFIGQQYLVIWLTTSGDVTYGPRPYSVERTPRLGASILVIIPLRLVSVKSYEYALMVNFLGRAV